MLFLQVWVSINTMPQQWPKTTHFWITSRVDGATAHEKAKTMIIRSTSIGVATFLLCGVLHSDYASAESVLSPNELLSLFSAKKALSDILGASRPREVVGEDYRNNIPSPVSVDVSEADQACDEAAKRFTTERKRIEQQRAYASVAGYDYDDERYRSAVDDWESRCFRPVADAQAPAITTSIGYLELDGVPFCTAFYGPQEHLLTARHCFFDKKNNTPNDFHARLADVGFHSIAQPSEKIKITGFVDDFKMRDVQAIPHASDIVGLLTQQSDPTRVPLAFRAPSMSV